MKWYAVHLILSEGEMPESGGKIKVQESIYLMKAANQDELFRKAAEKGYSMVCALRQSWWTLSDGSRRMASDAKFLGVRKVVEIQSDTGNEDTPVDMTELTYSFFEANNFEDARLLAEGENAPLIYLK